MIVIEIAPHLKPQANLIPGYEEATVINIDIDPERKADVIADAAFMPFAEGSVDGVFASHVLEHFSYWVEMSVLAGWAACLKPGGVLHIVVPSLEWCARQILSDHPSKALLGTLYAGQTTQWDVHLNGFTMRKLRSMFERLGLNVIRARSGKFRINVIDEIHESEQHYIAGMNGTPELAKS